MFHLASFFGCCLFFFGVVSSKNLHPFKSVTLRNGTKTECQIITAENPCTPGYEILEECDHEYGPMKCVPCPEGLYQCDYITSEFEIKCYPVECPELGKETVVSQTYNKDGTCAVTCICNEAKGYSGPDYQDCKLLTTPCELRNGSCVGCDKGYYNPDETFGRCIPEPQSESTDVTPPSVDGNTEEKSTLSSEVITLPETTPGQTFAEKTTTRQVKDGESAVSGAGTVGIVLGVIAIGAMFFITIVVVVVYRNGTTNCNNSAFCCGNITHNGTNHDVRAEPCENHCLEPAEHAIETEQAPAENPPPYTSNDGDYAGVHLSNIPRNIPNGAPRNQPNGIPGSQPNGIPRSQPNGIPRSEPNGIPRSEPNGIPRNGPNGRNRGEVNGVPRVLPNCIPRSRPNEVPGNHNNVTGILENHPDDNTGSHVNVISQDQPSGICDDGSSALPVVCSGNISEVHHDETSQPLSSTEPPSFPTLATTVESSLIRSGSEPTSPPTIQYPDPDNTHVVRDNVPRGEDDVLEPLLPDPSTLGLTDLHDESIGVSESEIPTLLRTPFSADSLV